jgi:hypothetical protein
LGISSDFLTPSVWSGWAGSRLDFFFTQTVQLASYYIIRLSAADARSASAICSRREDARKCHLVPCSPGSVRSDGLDAGSSSSLPPVAACILE